MEVKNIAIVTVTALTIYAALKHKKPRKKVFELLNTGEWKLDFLFIVLFCSYIFYSTKNSKDINDIRRRDALKKSIIAFIIAIFAELGLTIATFWLVFTFSFYMEGWI